eukprot:SAG31_NODE_166_length_21670_cov_22.507719_11_plen_92_part_00
MLCFRTRRFQRYPTALEWSKKSLGEVGPKFFFRPLKCGWVSLEWPRQISEDFVCRHVLKLPLQVGSGACILLFRMLPPLLNDGDNESAASG